MYSTTLKKFVSSEKFEEVMRTMPLVSDKSPIDNKRVHPEETKKLGGTLFMQSMQEPEIEDRL